MTAWFVLGLAVAAGVATAAIGMWRAQRRDGRLSFEDFIAMAFAWVAVVFCGSVVGVGMLGFDVWDLISVVYVPAVAGLPVAAVLLVGSHVASGWVSWCRPLTRPALVGAAALMLLAPLGFYATHVAPFDLQVDEIDVIVGESRIEEPIVVGVISDIQTEHLTDYEKSAVRELVDADPDVILIAGDVWQGSAAGFEAEREELRALFEFMSPPAGAFLVTGDVDSSDELAVLTEGTDVRVLDGEIARTEVAGTDITIGGVGLRPRPRDREMIDDLESAPGDDLRVLLAHRPDWAFELPTSSRIDLVVAGHTHGGQIQIPGLGAAATASQRVPRDAAAGGLHELNGNTTYISTGVGHEQQGAPQVRFLAPPSIGVLTLRP
ncbi:MAG: metallophosphoesterase [Acidimicrobiia bacterium]|nr:metallophosphoesterase [Acidimicrobiia bacterium]